MNLVYISDTKTSLNTLKSFSFSINFLIYWLFELLISCNNLIFEAREQELASLSDKYLNIFVFIQLSNNFGINFSFSLSLFINTEFSRFSGVFSFNIIVINWR